jgi:hypothetical protein
MICESQNHFYWTSNILRKITLSYNDWAKMPNHYSLGKIIFYYIFYFELVLSVSFSPFFRMCV